MDILFTIIAAFENESPDIYNKIIQSIPKKELEQHLVTYFQKIHQNNMSCDNNLNLKLLTYVLKCGIDVNCFDATNGDTLLIILTRTTYNNYIIELLKYNPDINITNKRNKTALQIAESLHHTDMASSLLNYKNKSDQIEKERINKKLEELEDLREQVKLTNDLKMQNIELTKQCEELKKKIIESVEPVINKPITTETVQEIQIINQEQSTPIIETFAEKRKKAEEKFKLQQKAIKM